MDAVNEHINPELISAYLSKSISLENKILVESWIATSPENAILFEEYKTIWNETGNISPTPIIVDTEVAWKQMSKRIDTFESNKKSFNLTRILKVAAIITLPILIVSVSYLLFKTPDIKTITLTTNQITNDTLTDGSIVTLQSNSSIEYSSDFNSKSRIVKMKGEAFFDIAHNKQKPFIIKTANSIIQVVGTKFNVKSFANSSQIEVLVESGKVIFMVVEVGSNDTSSISLVAGEKGIYNKKTHVLQKIVPTNTNELFWKTKTLSFNKSKLSDVAKTLELYYNVKINSDKSIADLKYTSEFNNEPIDSIMEIIKNTLEIHITKDGNTYNLQSNE